MSKKKTNAWDYDSQKQKRKKVKRKKNITRGVVIALSLIVVLLAGGVVGLSYFAPDIAQSIAPVNYVKENVLNLTTTTTMPPTTTTTVPTKRDLSYIEFSDFALKSGKEGNFVGNITNGGEVGFDASFVYHIANGNIYRFAPSTESYTCLYKSDDSLSSMNLRGDYVYYINDTQHTLNRLNKSNRKNEVIADNASLAYLYDSTLYYLATDDSLCLMDTKALEPHTIYYADGKLELVGVSLTRVFVCDNYDGMNHYLTIDNNGDEICTFRQPSRDGDIVSFTMENGFAYYYKKSYNGSYDLLRQKYGSSKTVTLVENVSCTDSVIVDSNKVFYAEIDGDKYKLKELNMNTNDTKTMLSVSNVGDDDNLRFYHSSEYDFIIGKDVYKGSSNLTSSANVMKFKNGKWKY